MQVQLQLTVTFVSQVGFSNLVKRDKDQMRHVWVAEATESSTYSLSHEIPKKSHLKEAATSAEKWASNSHPVSFFTPQRSCSDKMDNLIVTFC